MALEVKPNPTFIDFEKDRYGSLKLIDWFDINRVQKTKVLVIGAGAIGNEVLKNLALLGVGNIFIYDRDTIEMSNLSRSVLFREADCNKLKAETAADAIRFINSDLNVRWQAGDIRFDLGLGVIRRMDVVIGCLDNREARLKINTDCLKIGKTWIDAGIGQLNGQVRVFSALEGACYECTFTEDDYRQVEMACNRLASIYASEGKIPTTPTIASIVAGVQVQETLKLLDYNHWHGRTLIGKELIFNGTVGDVSIVEIPFNKDCPAHEGISENLLIELPDASAASTIRDFFAQIEEHLGENPYFQLNFELALQLRCPNCGRQTPLFKPQRKLFQEDLICEACQQEQNLVSTHTIVEKDGNLFASASLSSFGQTHRDQQQIEYFPLDNSLTLKDLNIAALDILECGSADGRYFYFELTGDGNSL